MLFFIPVGHVVSEKLRYEITRNVESLIFVQQLKYWAGTECSGCSDDVLSSRLIAWSWVVGLSAFEGLTSSSCFYRDNNTAQRNLIFLGTHQQSASSIEICESRLIATLQTLFSSSRIFPRCDRGDYRRETTCWTSYDFFMGTSKCCPFESSHPHKERSIPMALRRKN